MPKKIKKSLQKKWLRTIDPEYKGQEIHIVAGDYKGMEGWLNRFEDETDDSYHVILYVKTKSDGVEKGYYKVLRKASVKLGHRPTTATSRDEAVVMQIKGIEDKMVQLARKLVEHGVHPESRDIYEVFHKMLCDAQEYHSAKPKPVELVWNEKKKGGEEDAEMFDSAGIKRSLVVAGGL